MGENNAAGGKGVINSAQTSANVCALCHQRGTGCCVLNDTGLEGMFGLTGDEVSVISKASGLAPEEFTVRDRVTRDFESLLAAVHPLFALTMPNRNRIRLKVDRDGACVFLGPGGCRLPVEARPCYCRLYPFWFTPDDRLMVMVSDTCQAQEGALSYKDVLKRMGLKPDGLREIFAGLKKMAARHAEAAK